MTAVIPGLAADAIAGFVGPAVRRSGAGLRLDQQPGIRSDRALIPVQVPGQRGEGHRYRLPFVPGGVE